MLLEVAGRSVYGYTGGRPVQAAATGVIFIHGAQHDHSVWILQSRYLAHHGHAVLALDLPGHGRSSGPALSSVEALADWVLETIAAAGFKTCHLVGHSMGSLVALEAAARGGDRIASLSLLGAAAPMRVSQALLDAARDDEARAFDMINAWSHSGITPRPGCPGPGFSIFNQNRRLMERQVQGVLLNDFSACNAYEGALAAASAVRCPTLLVSGQRDLMTPPTAAAALISALQTAAGPAGLAPPVVVHIPDCGHAMMAEKPLEILHALKNFLARATAPV
jgi:pimeloyl-ACP methyl ester carboxylesterase